MDRRVKKVVVHMKGGCGVKSIMARDIVSVGVGAPIIHAIKTMVGKILDLFW
jgi:hypothetical protein